MVTGELLDEKWVTARFRRDGPRPSVAVVAEPRRCQIVSFVRGQGAERKLPLVEQGLCRRIVERPPQARDYGGGLVAVAREQHHGRGTMAVKYVREQHDAVAIGPLKVVHEEDQRTHGRHRTQELD